MVARNGGWQGGLYSLTNMIRRINRDRSPGAIARGGGAQVFPLAPDTNIKAIGIKNIGAVRPPAGSGRAGCVREKGGRGLSAEAFVENHNQVPRGAGRPGISGEPGRATRPMDI